MKKQFPKCSWKFIQLLIICTVISCQTAMVKEYQVVPKGTSHTAHKPTPQNSPDYNYISTLKALESKSAKPCNLPLRGLVFDASDFEKQKLALKPKWDSFAKDDIQSVIVSVSSCKTGIEMKINDLKENISRRIAQKSMLEGSLNIKDMVQRNKTLKTEKIKIKKSFQEDIKNHDMKGLFAVLIESNNDHTNADIMINAARHYMGREAIRTFLGVMLKSRTWLKNDYAQSRISAQSSGGFKIDTPILSDPQKYYQDKTICVYAAEIRISPLKQAVAKKTQLPGNLHNCGVVNLLSDNWQNDFKQILVNKTSRDYARTTIKDIEKRIDSLRINVEKYNQKALAGMDRKNKDLKKQLDIKDREILKAVIEIDKSRKQLNTIYKGIGMPQSDTPEKNLEKGIAAIQDHINQLNADRLAHNQQIMETLDKRFQITNNRIKETTQKALLMYRNMKETHCKEVQFFDKTIVENATLTAYKQSHNIQMKRIPQKVHVYPYSGDGQAGVLLLMQFSIDALKESDDLVPEDTIRHPPPEPEEPAEITDWSPPARITIRSPPAKITKKWNMEFVLIKAGTFLMGSPNEPGRYSDENRHQVTITKDFYMQTTEVTQGQWEAVMGSNPSYFKNCGKNCPVESISWEDVKQFIKKLNLQDRSGTYRLPTEAEWEYAARAGTKTALYTGDIEIKGYRNAPALDPIAWYGGNSCVKYNGAYDCSSWPSKQYQCSKCGTHPVGQKRPNSWGLYDMIGNVCEWCEDSYTKTLIDGVDPLIDNDSGLRVFRGGSWSYVAGLCRSAERGGFRPGNRGFSLGFRLVLLRGQ